MLFLQSPGNHPEVPNDLYMNGVISSVPWHGHQEYGITWDTSVLPTALEKSAICHYIVKTDQHCISMLKMAWFTFNKKNGKCAFSVMTSHPIYIHLQHKYGLDLKKRKRVEDKSESEEGSDEE
mgnify:CR=1 FL=1